MATVAHFVATNVNAIDAVTDEVELTLNPYNYASQSGSDTLHPQAGTLLVRLAHSEGITVGATVSLTTG